MSNTNNSEDKELNHTVGDKKFLKFKRKKILSSKKLRKREERNCSENQVESSRYIDLDEEERSDGESASRKKEESPKSRLTISHKNESDNVSKNIEDYIPNIYTYKKPSSSSRALLAKSLENLKTNNDEIILSTLIELTSELSIANDSLAHDINCQALIKEIIIILDKYFSPEILMYSMICINYILDLNPAFTSLIIKSGGVNKIIELTRNIEFIDCAENAIKVIEKMSYENPYVLVEKGAFSSILTLIDFFDMNLRKSAIMACVNMSKSSSNYDFYIKNTQPAVQALTNLTKYFGNSEVEKFILDKSIVCFYNIINSIKNFNFHSQDKKILINLIQYGFLNNLFDVLTTFLKLLNDEKPTDNKNINIYLDTLKNILKVFESLCSQSSEITNLILNMNILQIVNTILLKELGLHNSDQIRNKLGSSHHAILNEIFALLNSFFPNKDSKEQDKIVSEQNKQFYLFFSEKIINILVKEIINIPSSNTVIQVIKLVEMYINYSQNEFIITFVDQSKLSNICAKMLDSKDVVYIREILNLVDIIMKKVPERFIVPFLREGVLENINKIITTDKDSFYIPEEKSNLRYLQNEKEIIELEKEVSKHMVESDHDKRKEIKKTMLELLKRKGKHSRFIEAEDTVLEDNNHQLILENNVVVDKNNKVNEEKDDDLMLGMKEILGDNNKPSTSEKKEVKEEPVVEKKKISSYQDKVVSNIQNIAKELINKYFKDEKQIDNFIQLGKSTVNPKDFLHKLEKIASDLKEFDTVDESVLIQLCDILFNKEKLTFYEIEKSKIIYYLAKYFDENFILLLEKKSEKLEDSCLKRNLDQFFKVINYDTEKIKDLILILQNSISSMNCFKLYLYEFGNYKNTSYLFSSAFRHQPHGLKLKLNYKSSDFDKELYKDNLSKDLTNYYSSKKQVVLNIEHNETFNSLEEAILDKTYKNVSFGSVFNPQKSSSNNSSEALDEILMSSLARRKNSEDFENTEKFLQKFIERKQSLVDEIKNEITEENSFNNLINEGSSMSLPYKEPSLSVEDLEVNFFLEINNERILVNKDLSVSDWLKEIKKSLKKSEMNNLCNDLQISFEIGVKKKECIYNNTNEVLTNYDLFIEAYRKNILKNPTFYSIKRAGPYFYIISLMDLALNKFPDLFFFKTGIEEKSLENQKVSSLLIKQVRDPYAISSNQVPNWCRDISQNLTYLANFNARYLFFKTCSFEIKRSMTNLYIYVKSYMGENLVDDKTLSLTKRRKVKIDRDNFITCAEKIMKETAYYNGYLEFEYNDEIGTGQGPTLEFYNLLSKEYKENKEIWFKTSDYSLFPLPLSHLSEENKKKVKRSFQLLGYFIARALYDDRLIDIPFNGLFWDLLLEREISFQKIDKLDPSIYRVLHDLIKLSEAKIKFIEERKASQDISEYNLEDIIKYNGKKLSEIEVSFTLPGYPDIPLKQGGENIYLDIYNIDEYIKLIYEQFFRSGTKEAFDSFRYGFNSVFPVKNLKAFLSSELEEILCSSTNENWDYETLYENINPNHGYYKNSVQYKYLIQILIEMSNQDRKKFLAFVTGAPRLPLGGFKNLNPKMTFVKKAPETSLDNPDSYLPTVMTCQNYLKVPEYSSYEVFKTKLYIAMYEGLNAFYLS